MRKIELAEKPVELTQEEETRLVNIYKRTGEAVWRKPYITAALLQMTYSKCAYSEAKLQEGGAYMEVDHFHPKSLYPEEVVKWGNLLPATKTSNTAKGNTDTRVVPLINPLKDNPKDYLRYVGALCMVKNLSDPIAKTKAKNSIDLYALNSQHYVKQRADRIHFNQEEFSWLAQEVKEGVLKNGGNPLKRWKARLIAQLEDAQPSEPYSVCIAQAMKDNDDLKFIIKELQNMKMVDKRIQKLLSNI